MLIFSSHNYKNLAFLNQMGSNLSYSPTLVKFRMEDWQKISLSTFTDIKDPSYGSNFTVYANRLNPSSQIQKYDLFFNTYPQFTAYKQTVEWRNSIRYVVPIKYLCQPGKQQLCGSFYRVEAFLERTPIRLVEIQDISIQEGLCILYSSLQGFEQLVVKYGFFQPEPQMICFSKQGFVRVWLNFNLSKNHPQSIYADCKNKTFAYFVKLLIEMLQTLIQFQGHLTLSQFIKKCKVGNPYEKMNVVLELYARQLQIVVPRYLSSIRNICQDQRKRSSTLRQKGFMNKMQRNQSFVSKNSRQFETMKQNMSGYVKSKRSSKEVNKTVREPLEELNFKKTASFNNYRSLISQTSRTPTVRFNYPITLTNSPKANHIPEVHLARKTVSTVTSPDRKSSNASLYCFRKEKKAPQKCSNAPIDPEIAADLALLTL